ncbi:MAG: NuoM family protein [Phycisphaerales bacterium]
MLPIALILVPLLGVLPIVFLPAARAKWVALATTGITFLVSIVAAMSFGRGADEAGWGLRQAIPWLESIGVTLNMRADMVSLMLILLTTFLMPLCILGSFTAVNTRLKEYYAWLLVLQGAMTGVFLASDVIFFYICFEFTLVPMYFLIAIYGGEGRAAAAVKFFLYTFTGSLVTLAGVLYLAWWASGDVGGWTFDIQTLTDRAVNGILLPADGVTGGATLMLSGKEQALLLLALMAGFAVKVPLFPVHTWLPLAHTEAPTAGSVVLAGVLLKLGTYGLYRFVLPIVPEAVVEYAPIIGILAVIAILYGALICWVQDDVKKLVAYSSVSHLGFCVLGLFALNPMGLQGSVLYMINHGLSTGALFFMIGMMYERYHTRDMNKIGGLAKKMPVWACFMVFFVLSSVGLPGLNGFVSEFLCLIAAFTATGDAGLAYPGMLGPWYAAFAGVGMILAAMYLLIMTGKVVFGPLREPAHGDDDHSPLPADMNAREIAVVTPLAILCVVLGLQPGLLMDRLDAPIEQLLGDADYPRLVREALAADAASAVAADEAGADFELGITPESPATSESNTTPEISDGALTAATVMPDLPAVVGVLPTEAVLEDGRDG